MNILANINFSPLRGISEIQTELVKNKIEHEVPEAQFTSTVVSGTQRSMTELSKVFLDGVWTEPELLSNGNYKVISRGFTSNPGSTQELYYNPQIKQVVEIGVYQATGEIVSTKLNWCIDCEILYPKSIDIETIMTNTQITKVKIEYTSYLIPKGISDRMFEVK